MRSAILLSMLSALICSAQPVTLVSLTNTWRYNQTGLDLGTAWIAPEYDDSAWSSGRGVFAYETQTERVWRLTNTVLRLNNPGEPPLITYYFRTHFEVPTPVGGATSMTFSNLIDDGAVVYVNGQEVYRINMPLGPIEAGTLAPHSVAAQEEGTFITTNLSSVYLHAGDNVLAVEVHQANVTSTDVHFGLSLDYAPWIVVDTINPEITSAEMGFSRDEVLIQFSGRLDPYTASNRSHYSILADDGAPLRVLGARLTNFNQVVLTTDPRRDGPRYILTARDVQAEGGSFMTFPRKRTVGYAIQWDTLGGTDSDPFLVWRYDQSGREAPPDWHGRNFDDSTWPSGRTALAFDDNAELQHYIRTTLTRWAEPCCSTQIVTYYFRAPITNAAAVRAIDLAGYIDDGAVFYWNGAEIARVRMPAGTINYQTYATQAVEAAFSRLIVPLPDTVPGVNTLAAEVHQPGAINNDIFFGLWITGLVPSEPVLPTLRYVRSGAELLLDWDDPQFDLQSAFSPTGPWTTQPYAPHPVRRDMQGAPRFFRLKKRP